MRQVPLAQMTKSGLEIAMEMPMTIYIIFSAPDKLHYVM
jgi:hypothetical protein